MTVMHSMMGWRGRAAGARLGGGARRRAAAPPALAAALTLTLAWALTADGCGSRNDGAAAGDGGSRDSAVDSGGPAMGGSSGATGGASGGGGTGPVGSGGGGAGSGMGGSSGAGSGGNGGTGGTAGAAGTGGTAGSTGSTGVVAAGVRWLGRVALTDPARPRFAWSGTGFVARFTGDSLTVRLNDADAFVFKAVVDGVARPAFAVARGEGMYTLASGLSSGPHTVALYRQTEGVYGDSQLLGITVAGGALMDPPPPSGRLIQVVGASVSCGYGDLGMSPCSFSFATESHYDTYESVAARALGAELEVVAISGRGVLRNSDGSTTGTMPMLYPRVLPGSAAPTWDATASAPQVVVINLGKNDFASGDPGQAFVDAYASFMRTLRQRHGGALIVGATGPNLGAATHARQLEYVNMAIAARQRDGDSNVALLDWTEETPAETGCDVHPTAPKHQQMGMALADLVRTRLGW